LTETIFLGDKENDRAFHPHIRHTCHGLAKKPNNLRVHCIKINPGYVTFQLIRLSEGDNESGRHVSSRFDRVSLFPATRVLHKVSRIERFPRTITKKHPGHYRKGREKPLSAHHTQTDFLSDLKLRFNL
jgi:hypothetical protein